MQQNQLESREVWNIHFHGTQDAEEPRPVTYGSISRYLVGQDEEKYLGATGFSMYATLEHGAHDEIAREFVKASRNNRELSFKLSKDIPVWLRTAFAASVLRQAAEAEEE